MRWRTLVGGTLCALVLVASASAGARVRTVPLKITISGAGTVKVSGESAVKCASFCQRSLHVEKGSRVTLVAVPGKLGRLGRWTGACTGSASRCALRVMRKEQVTATFVPPGKRNNPIPMGTRWPIGDGWKLKVVAATPNADGQVIDNASDAPLVPSSGDQFFVLEVELTFAGTGSGMLEPMAQNWSAEGSHNFKYEYFDDTTCGVAADVSLPAPNLQPLILNNQSVSSGQSVKGHICLQIATDDASTLRLNTAPRQHSGIFDVWFSLR